MGLFRLNLILIIFFLTSISSAQHHSDLFSFYTNHQIEKLENRLSELENAHHNDPEVLFFRTVLSDNGDNAFSIYERLYNQSKGPLKNLCAYKLSEYYFARGFYVRSSEYKNIAKTYIPVKTTEEIKTGDNNKENTNAEQVASIYKIQVGAFGVSENANDLAAYLKDKKFEVSVVTRVVNGNNLYCVWVDGGSSIEDTKDIADDIKKKYRLSYRILKP